ncbi:MAG: hypothetical protein LUE88_04565 [Clostridiales bacterium]|nr:hypothetical protein [Clostridiales bacterium]
MKFAEIVYSKKQGNIIANRLKAVFSPFASENITVLGAEGYRIGLNINENADEKSRKTVLKKAAAFLEENGVTAASGESFEGVYRASGKPLMALLAKSIVDVSDESVIIAGDRELTETVLCVLCPGMSYVSLLTDEGYRYVETAEYFFREYGINIQIINSFKHENFRNAGIVVNCGGRIENYDYLLKKGCLYYDIENDETRLKRLRRIRKDIRIVNAVKIGGREKINAEEAECALYVRDTNFKKLADGLQNGGLNLQEKLNIIENIGLSPLTSN